MVALAAAEGVALALAPALAAMAAIALAMPGQRSSTAQDMARGRPTEIDHLNGHVVRLGARLGVIGLVNIAKLSWTQAFFGTLVFVPGDLIKCAVCAMVVHTLRPEIT